MDFPALDPVLFDLPGPIDIRWYGLMYVVWFVIGQWILVRAARSGFFPVRPEQAPDLIFYCVFGVMLGGRTGYALFYDQSLLHPAEFLQVWKGGLAFHGGLAGVGVASWLFCRRHHVTWRRTADALALAICPGVFAVRCANFINGELYGRVTEKGVGWAMQFPTDPMATRLLGIKEGWQMRERELCVQAAFGKVDPETLEASIRPRHTWTEIRTMADSTGELLVPYRHPSQLYEGIGEGLVLGIVIWFLYRRLRLRPVRPGMFAVVFLLGYAAVRWSLELVRQPDAQFGATGEVLLGMTMGQTLSTLMVVAAALVLFWPTKPAAPAPAADGVEPPARE